VLSVSPALLEDYLSAARIISRKAVGDPTLRPVIDSYKISKALVQDDRVGDDLPFGSRGGALIRYYFPVDAEYSIKVLLRRQEYDYIVGMGERHQLDFRLDGALLKRFSVGGEGKGMTTPENFAGNTQGDPEWEEYMHTADAHLEMRTPVKAGLHEVGVSFVGRSWEPEGILQPPQTGFGRTTNEYYHGNPAVEIVSIGGPYGVLAPGRSTARRKLFICDPKAAASEEPARKILSSRRAYRRLCDRVHALLGFTGGAPKPDSGRHPARLERILAAELSLPRRTRAGWRGAGSSLSPERTRPGIATVVLPLGQHSRRRAARRGGPPDVERSRRDRKAGAADAPRSALERPGRQFRQPLARAEQALGRRPRHGAVFGIRRKPA
jgi:hypothetical protein